MFCWLFLHHTVDQVKELVLLSNHEPDLPVELTPFLPTWLHFINVYKCQLCSDLWRYSNYLSIYLNHHIHVYTNVSFSGEAHIEFCCHIARGNIDPKETPVYEYVKFVGDFKFHKNGKNFSGQDSEILKGDIYGFFFNPNY